jgi:hypothetical protein
MNKVLVGVNIQYPISKLILEGTKTIETRTYPLPEKYVDCDMALIETPGKSGDFSARVVAVIRFGKSFKYKSKKAFYSDTVNHGVTPDSPWKWDKPKWGWPILSVDLSISIQAAPKKKGIVFTKKVKIKSL